MATPSTRPTGADVTAFLDRVEPAARRADGHRLRALMEEITGHPATMWGPSIVGFGSMAVTNTSGTNEWFRVGFSPRRTSLVLYGVHHDDSADARLQSLGPHTTGKGCLYIKRLDDIDIAVVRDLIATANANA